MRRAPGLRHGALWALLFCAACHVGDDTQQNCDGKTYSDYIKAVIPAELTYYKRCTLLSPDGLRDPQMQTLIGLNYPAYRTSARDASAMSKRSSWDPSCVVSALQTAPCTDGAVAAVEQSCALKEATGCLPAGSACVLPQECSKGYCKGIPAGNQCGTGVCTAYGKAGSQCPEGDVACDPASAYCNNGVCQPLNAAGGSCAGDNQCQGGLKCLLTSAAGDTGTCGMPHVGAAGEPCDRSDAVGKLCGSGLSCYPDNLMTYRCQPVKKVGDVCVTSEACPAPATCVRKQATDTMGTCQAPGAEGAPCSTDPTIGSSCQKTLQCYSFDPMMQPPACQPLAVNGQPCAAGMLDCLDGVCNSGTCRPKAGTGLSCVNNTDCASNVCDSMKSQCVTPTCPGQ